MQHRRKRRFDIGGTRGVSRRRWLRELPTTAPNQEPETCRNPTCEATAATASTAHGFCERCWNSKVRVLPIMVPRRPDLGGAPPDRTA